MDRCTLTSVGVAYSWIFSMADHGLARKVDETYIAPSIVEACRGGQATYDKMVTIRDANHLKPTTIVICPWYLDKMMRTLWRDSNALTSLRERIENFQQWPDLKPMYVGAVLIDFYVFFNDILLQQVVYFSRRYYHY